MRAITIACLGFVLSSCKPDCDYKVNYDTYRQNYWIFQCVDGTPSVLIGSPFTTYEEAAKKVQQMRAKPEQFIEVPR